MKLTNIKISLKSSDLSLHTVSNKAHQQGYKVSCRNNFILLRREYLLTIFKNKIGSSVNHINVTKIKVFSEITSILKKLKDLGINCSENSVVIDNITGQLDTSQIINLRKIVTSNIQHIINNYRTDICIRVKYNNETFPGAFLKFSKDRRKLGTSIIFHSGKVIFVGCKTEKDLKCLSHLTHVIILLMS